MDIRDNPLLRPYDTLDAAQRAAASLGDVSWQIVSYNGQNVFWIVLIKE